MPAPSKPKREKKVELPPEGMDVLEVSPLRIAGLADVRSDLSQHQRRIEKLLAEMLQKTLGSRDPQNAFKPKRVRWTCPRMHCLHGHCRYVYMSIFTSYIYIV